MDRVAVIILNWNGKEDTLACLRSLSSIQNVTVLVVDNGSTDDSVEAISFEFPQYQLIQTRQNLGFAEGNNVGIRVALSQGAEYILLLNNDTLVFPDFIEHLLAVIKQNPKVGIVGGKPVQFSSPEKLDHLGGMWNPKKGVFTLVGAGDKEEKWQESEELDYVCGAALMAKREVFEKVGLLESRFFLVWEEADFCLRAKRWGFLSVTAPQAKVLHKVSASFVGGKPQITYFWWRNRLFWIKRNCSRGEQYRLWAFVLLPEILKLVKLFCLKKIQFYIYCFLNNSKGKERGKVFLDRTRAALMGIGDYMRGRLGPAPKGLTK